MKKKVFVHTGFILLIIVTLSLSWFFIKTSFLDAASTKTEGFFINDIFDAPSVKLQNGETVTQDFSTDKNIYGMKIRFSNGGKPQPGNILVELKDKASGKVIQTKTENSETLLNDAYTVINFASPYLSAGKGDFTLSITPAFARQDAQMSIWQDSATKSWAFGVVSYVVSGFIYSWFMLLIVLMAAAAVGIYLVCFVFKLKKETTFIICLCLVSVLFNFVLPPYSSPDEEGHINSAYCISNQLFDGKLGFGVNTDVIDKRTEDYSERFEDKNTTVLSYEYVHDNFFKLAKGGEKAAKEDSWIVSDSPAVYILGATGIKLGSALKLGYVPMLYLGRLFNLAFFALCAYMAVKLVPVGKSIFMVLSFLPITLHLANSFSRDAFVISMSFVLIAHITKLLYQKENCSVKDAVLLVIICVLLAPAKVIYAPICLLVVLCKDKFSFIKIDKKHLAVGILALLGLAFFATNGWIKDYIAGALFHSEPLEQMLYTTPEKTFDIGIILANPVVSLKLFLNTLYTGGAYYIKSLMGGVLGYNSIIISDFFIFIFLLLTTIATFKTPDDQIELQKKHRISYAAVFFLVFMLVVYAGVSWTPIVDKTIYGIQGKYLMPCMPLLLLAAKNKVFTVTKDIFKPLCFVAAITNIYVVLNAFVIIVQR